MNERIKDGLELLKPGSGIPVDVKTVANLYAALRFLVEMDDELSELYLKDQEKENSCPVCKQDVPFMTGSGRRWLCGTCGFSEKVEPEEP